MARNVAAYWRYLMWLTSCAARLCLICVRLGEGDGGRRGEHLSIWQADIASYTRVPAMTLSSLLLPLRIAHASSIATHITAAHLAASSHLCLLYREKPSPVTHHRKRGVSARNMAATLIGAWHGVRGCGEGENIRRIARRRRRSRQRSGKKETYAGETRMTHTHRRARISGRRNLAFYQ